MLAVCFTLLSVRMWVRPWGVRLLSLLSATYLNALTLLWMPLALALVHSSNAPLEQSATHLIIPNPSALTCQDFKERKPDVLI
jgi:hypothetical protein